MKRFFALAVSFIMLTTNVWADSAAAWAQDDIVKAYRYGIADTSMFESFKAPVTRQQFCSLCANLIRQWQGNGPELEVQEVTFKDTTDEDILLCASMGIVSGTGNGYFQPRRLVTRQEAAVMLYNTLDRLTFTVERFHRKNDGVAAVFLPHIFNDGAELKNWARDEIYTLYHMGVMQGNEFNEFCPEDSLTAEQAIVTFVRLYEAKNMTNFPNSEIYPAGEWAGVFDNTGGRVSLDLTDYNYNQVKPLYNPVYTDGKGNTYSAGELGYIYPFDNVYAMVNLGLGEKAVISNEATLFMPDSVRLRDIHTLKGDIAVMEVVRNDAPVGEYNYNGTGYKVFNLKTGEEINMGNGIDYIYPLGEDMYFAPWGNMSAGCILDSSFEGITGNDYAMWNTTFADGLCVMKLFNGGWEVINTLGERIYMLNIEENYDLVSAYGTTLILRDRTKGTYAVDFTGNGKPVTGFSQAEFTKDGRISVIKGGFGYIYNRDGSLVMDGADLSYSSFTAYDHLPDIYMGLGTDGVTDVLDAEGNVLFKGVYRNSIIEQDGGGVYFVLSDRNKVTAFDAYGMTIGSVVPENGNAGDFRIINGLILIPGEETATYYTPTGDVVANMLVK